MKNILLKDKIALKFDNEVLFEQFSVNDIEKISVLAPNILFEIGSHAWMIYAESSKKVDPYKLSKYFDAQDPYIYRRVEKVIKRKVIQDICFSYARVMDETLGRNICCQLHLCRMWPNDLFIADVEFSDPYKPVSKGSQKYQFHEYRSLGLFDAHLDKINSFCRNNSIGRITLTAATNDQIPYFEQYGFKIENNNMSKNSLAQGMGAAMYKKCI